MSWIEGDPVELTVEWFYVDDIIIPINPEKEITSVELIARTMYHPGGGFFDAFQLRPNLETEKLYAPDVTYIPMEEIDDTIEIPVFGAVQDCQIVSVHIMPEGDVTGNNTNYMALAVINKDTDGTICTKTYVQDVNTNSYTVDDFGPAADAHRFLTLGDGVSLQVTKHGTGFTLPRGLLIIRWDVA